MVNLEKFIEPKFSREQEAKIAIILRKLKLYDLSTKENTTACLFELVNEQGEDKSLCYEAIRRSRNVTYEKEESKIQTIPELFKKVPKKDRDVIDGIIPSQEVSGIYSPPACLKSMLALYMAACVSEGDDFLGHRTKKMPVLILSSENSIKTDVRRVKMIGKAMRKRFDLRRKNLNLMIMPRDSCGDMSNNSFLKQLGEEITKRSIKWVILDTASNLNYSLEGNNASAVMGMFKVFFNMIKAYGITITFLHHTNKRNDYLGSIKWKANTEHFYELIRDDEKSELLLRCEKSRDKERNIKMGYNFGKDNFTLSLIEDIEGKVMKGEDKVIIMEEVKGEIKAFLGQNGESKYAEIIRGCKKGSEGTRKRAIAELYKKGEIWKKKTGGYYLP